MREIKTTLVRMAILLLAGIFFCRGNAGAWVVCSELDGSVRVEIRHESNICGPCEESSPAGEACDDSAMPDARASIAERSIEQVKGPQPCVLAIETLPEFAAPSANVFEAAFRVAEPPGRRIVRSVIFLV